MSKTATIAIVGRPNVGKSTLFNRMTGKRTALVSDLPGLTRDRKEGVAEIWGHDVRLVDTAGLEEAASGSIAARMRAQTETAIADADLVLFVIDARAGVTPVDQEFARIVRQAGNRAILVANKCEGSKGSEGFYEAYALGLGEPVAISAEHGEGMSDLYGDIVEALALEMDAADASEAADTGAETEAEDDPARPIKVAIVGRPNAGKSTLVNALLGEERMITGPEPGLTRDAVATDLAWGGRTIRLFDTAGLRRKSKVEDTAEKLATSDTIRAIRFAEVVVLLIDAERGIEHQDLTIASMVADEGRALVIAINKWDLVVEKQKRLKELREIATDRLAAVAGTAGDHSVGTGRARRRQADARGAGRLRDLEQAGVDQRSQPLAARGAGSSRATGGEWAAHQDALHDAGLRPSADVRRILLQAGVAAGQLRSLSGEEPARDLRLSRRADPRQPAQGRQSLRARLISSARSRRADPFILPSGPRIIRSCRNRVIAR